MYKLYQDLKKQFASDLRIQPRVLIFEGIGTVSSLCASGCLSWYGSQANLGIILIFYLLGSILWAVASKIRANSFGLVLAASYTIINIVGLVKLGL